MTCNYFKSGALPFSIVLAFFLLFQQSAFAGHEFFEFRVSDTKKTRIEGELEGLKLLWVLYLPHRRGEGKILSRGEPAWSEWRGLWFILHDKTKSYRSGFNDQLMGPGPDAKVIFEDLHFIDEKSGQPLEIHYLYSDSEIPFSLQSEDFRPFFQGLEINYVENKVNRLEARVLGSFKMKKVRLKYRFRVVLPDGRSEVAQGEELLMVTSRWRRRLS